MSNNKAGSEEQPIEQMNKKLTETITQQQQRKQEPNQPQICDYDNNYH